jgi:hypothetical protein
MIKYWFSQGLDKKPHRFQNYESSPIIGCVKVNRNDFVFGQANLKE